MSKLQLVQCDKHGPDQLGYIVCQHVLSGGAKVAHHLPARPEELGEIFCGECLQISEAGENRRLFETVKIACAPCAMPSSPASARPEPPRTS